MARMRGLYPIVDLDTLASRKLSPLPVTEAILSARPPMLQLRAKHQTPREVLGLLREMRELCATAGTQLVANDRPDLALLAHAHGVHVGQDDVPVEAVRQLCKLRGASADTTNLRIGVSTHDLNQLERALLSRPDYVAFGPIFATRSKTGADPALGLELLERAAETARAAAVPLVAIGGLTLDVAPKLASLGVIGAVISDLFAGGDSLSAIAARAQAFQRTLAES